MAASGSARSKRRKKTDEEELDELTKIVLDLASEPKKPKKESHFQFYREPLTGRRKSYYPYRQRRPASPPPSSLGMVCPFFVALMLLLTVPYSLFIRTH